MRCVPAEGGALTTWWSGVVPHRENRRSGPLCADVARLTKSGPSCDGSGRIADGVLCYTVVDYNGPLRAMWAEPMQENHEELVGVGLSNRPILLMEEERHRLARELHDDLLQTLTSLGLRLDLCRQLSIAGNSTALDVELSRLKICLEESMTAMGRLAVGHASFLSEGESLREAIERCVRDYESESGITVTVDFAHLAEDALCAEQRAVVFRVVQEALRNTRRHSKASRVQISAEDEAEILRVSIEDDGAGFHLASATEDYPQQGLGLAGMRERASAAGGQLVIESQPGSGTSVTLSLPLRNLTGWVPKAASGSTGQV
jgi:signal transduction histidine kinase